MSNRANYLGSYVSWLMDSYDLGAVVITATVLEKLFYPTLGLVGSVLPIVFTVVTRPLGGFLLGYLSDLYGRKRTLIFTVLGYSLAIGLTGLLPTYYQIGVLAPVLLSILRMVQGIFIGGDVSSSFTLAMESVRKWRGLASGVMQSGTLVGFVIVDLLFSYLSLQPGFIEVGWRIIFLLGAIPAALALIIRYKMTESKVYLESEKLPPLKGLKPVLQTIVVMIGFWVMIYAGPQFVPVFLGSVLKLKPSVYGELALFMNLIGIPAMTISGVISDFIGRRTMALIGIGVALATAWSFYFFAIHDLLLSILVFGFGMNLPSAITPAYLAERFKTFSRATGVGFSYNGAFIVAGFTSLVISLLSRYAPTNAVAFSVLAFGSVLSVIGLLAGPETIKQSELKVS
ncbi:MAG: major facilitator transporter [Candidatus Aramenus sulfurataquae]|jgi:MFS family permease|uniref:MFS transporter n=2 Tax=Candidatus Aramenus sulfurataquae TaxID=1326980 RepID=W7L7J0_9CREN|nr:MAG: major facilitator transporter [Candidatus Aramenus sulfurataquae]MCL7343821.1 MFS transporter [Candidatus Aramenus sulfurataquae]